MVPKFLQAVTLAQDSVKGGDLRKLSILVQTCDFILKGNLELGLELLQR